MAISDEEAQAALQQESTAAALLQEIRRRIREGTHRLVVPLYREQAEILLEKLAMRGLAPRSRKHGR